MLVGGVSRQRFSIGLCRNPSSKSGHNNFCGRDRLPHMTLRVIGDVHQQAGDGRGQLFPAHDSFLFERVCIECLNPDHALRQG